MAFDWIGFLKQQGVGFISSGKNVQRGHINVRCPFCGPADPHFHMGIRLEDGAWACWRNEDHRSRNVARLIVALTGMAWDEAIELVDEATPFERTSLRELSERLRNKPKPKSLLKVFNPPKHFLPIVDEGRRARFVDYLVERKFSVPTIPQLCADYSLRCSFTDDTEHRVIFPFIKGKHWYGYTARSIFKNARTRYLSFPDSRAVKQLVFNHNAMLEGGRALIVVEGPVDALKLDFYGKALGVRAIATLGTTATDEQAGILLHNLLRYGRRWDQVFRLLDPGALAQSLTLGAKLAALRTQTLFVPAGVEDPGAMRRLDVLQFCREVVLPRVAA